MKSIIRSIGKSMGKKASKQASINGEPPNDVKLSTRNSGDFSSGRPESTVSTDSSSTTNRKSSAGSGSYQDSAINELLEGRMKLTVNIVHRNEQLDIIVERRTPLLDLLVQIATQFHFNASNYLIQVCEDESTPHVREHKASTPIGLLDVGKVSVVPKPEKKVPSKSMAVAKSATFTRQQSTPGELPFKPTIRLQVNLPHNQLMVLRLMPNTGLAEIKQMICSEKSFDAGKYLLVKPFKSGQTPLVLDLDKTLDFYHINEVTILANKAYQELSRQFSTSNRNHFTSSMYDEGSNRLGEQVDMSQSTPNIAKLNGMYKRSVSESQTDLTSLKRADSAARTGRSYKSKPAPPPPLKSAKSVQHLAPIRDEEEERPSSDVYSSYEHHDSSSLSEHSTTTDGSKAPPPESVITVQPAKHRRLSRQNSGSDSSGYHEMLSHTETDTPTDSNSPAPPLSLSPNPSETTCSLVSHKPPVPSQRTSLSSKPSVSGGKIPAPKPPGSVTSSKKRRAPLPPSACKETQSNEKKSEKVPSVEAPVRIVESPCTEPNSLSLSSEEVASTASGTSSASSAFDESKICSLNNQSLSPIVIIKSSVTDTTNESVGELPIDEVAGPTLNSTMLETAKDVLELANEQPPKPAESTSPTQPTDEPETSTQIEPAVASPPEPETESRQPAELLAEADSQVFEESTGEAKSEHDISVTEQCTINGGAVNKHHSGTPINDSNVDVTAQVQPKPRLSTLGRDRASKQSSGDEAVTAEPVRRTSSTRDQYKKVASLSEQVFDSAEESQDMQTPHYHEHEEGNVCACELFTSKFSRIRSQFTQIEVDSILPKETTTVSPDEENCQNNKQEAGKSCKAETSICTTSSVVEADNACNLPLPKQLIDAEEVIIEAAVEDNQVDDEMNGSLKRPSVVTISEWKTAPKDNELLLGPGTNRNNSISSNASRSHSNVDRNLEKQVEVTLNELNDALDGLDTSELITPPSIRKKITTPVHNTASAAFSNHSRITVENGKSKINIVSGGDEKVCSAPTKAADNGKGSTKMSICSMKDAPVVVNSTTSTTDASPSVSTSPMKSVRDNIAKFSATSRNNLSTSRANYSASHQDLSSLHRSLPNTPAGTLLRRSSSKVAPIPGSNNTIPELESPQVTRKLANFRIGSFKKELDIYEQPKSLKPVSVTTGSWRSAAPSTTLKATGDSSSNDKSESKPSQVNGGLPKPSPTAATVNSNGAMPTPGTANSDLPKESAKKVFSHSSATSGAANQNGGRTFLQELKSRTWSHRTGLTPFDEEEAGAVGATDKTESFPKPSAFANSSNTKRPDLYSASRQQSAQTRNGFVNNPPRDQSDHKPAATDASVPPLPTPPPTTNIPPPPPPPPSIAPVSLANRSLSPELKQTNTLLAPKGWKSVKVPDQPKQIRSPLRSTSLSPVANGNGNGPKSPAASPVDQHDALLNEIRNFQTKSKLKKVANNEPFTLAVNSTSR